MRKSIFLLPVILLLTSCGTVYYMPNQHNVPLLRERGEVRINAAKANAGMISGPQDLPKAFYHTLRDQAGTRELQAAAAVSGHVGVMANATWYGQKELTNSQYGRLYEIAPGYFHAIGKHGVIEGYGGIGMMKTRHVYNDGHYSDTRFTRPFIQPIIGYASRNFDAALSTRVVRLHCNRRTTVGSIAERHLSEQIDTGDGRTLIEPAVMVRFGARSIKLQVQLGWSFCQGKEFARVDRTFGAGIQVNINNAFKRTTTSTTKPGSAAH